jgi:CheY-like chemotaxis protein
MYDLIVTDIRLGGKRDGGLQVMAASGLLSPDATVIVLTAYPGRGQPPRLAAAGRHALPREARGPADHRRAGGATRAWRAR